MGGRSEGQKSLGYQTGEKLLGPLGPVPRSARIQGPQDIKSIMPNRVPRGKQTMHAGIPAVQAIQVIDSMSAIVQRL